MLFYIFLLTCLSPIFSERRGTYQATHSFSSPFLYGMSSNIPFFEYGGSTVATEHYIRLVPAVQSRLGYIWNERPMKFRSWEVEMEFSIHNTHSPGADGLALWMTKERMTDGGRLWGGAEDFNGFGFVFDTYDNNHNGDNPAVILIQNDGRDNVDWDIDNDLLRNQLERCVSHFRNPINDKNSVKLTYENKKLTVVVDTLGKGNYQDCFVVNNIDIPTGLYLGITAATGGLADYHDIYGLYVRSFDDERNEPGYPIKDEKMKDFPTRRGRRKGWYDPYKESLKLHRQKQMEDEELNTNYNPENEEKDHGTRYGVKVEKQEQESDISRKLREAREKEEVRQKQEEEERNKEVEEEDKKESDFFDSLKVKLKELGLSNDEKKEKKVEEKVHVTTPSSTETKAMSSDTGIIIIEALEQVVSSIKHSSTKNDVSQIIRRVEKVSDSQQSIGQMMIDVNKDVKEQMEQLTEKLSDQTKRLSDEIKRLNNVLNNMGGTVTDMKRRQGNLEKSLTDSTQNINTVIEKSSSWGFGMYFIIFELLFIVAIYFYKKFRDEKKKKLL